MRSNDCPDFAPPEVSLDLFFLWNFEFNDPTSNHVVSYGVHTHTWGGWGIQQQMKNWRRVLLSTRTTPSSSAAVLTTPRVGPISSPFCVTNASEREFPAIDAKNEPSFEKEEELRMQRHRRDSVISNTHPVVHMWPANMICTVFYSLKINRLMLKRLP